MKLLYEKNDTDRKSASFITKHFNEEVNKELRSQIMLETVDRLINGKDTIVDPKGISLQELISENRYKALGVRFTSNSVIVGTKSYSGKEIADILIESVKKNGISYYPIKGMSWKDKHICQLVIFIKDDSRENKKWIPYARFDIDKIYELESPGILPNEVMKSYVDGGPFQFFATKRKTSLVCEISNCETENLPEDFISVASSFTYYPEMENGVMKKNAKGEVIYQDINIRSVYASKGGTFNGSSVEFEIL